MPGPRRTRSGSENVSTPFVLSLLPRVPELLVYAVGIFLAASYGQRLRTVALLAGAGFGLLAASWLLGAAFQYWAMALAPGTIASHGAGIAAFGLLRGATYLAGIVFLMIAIFIRRPAATAAP